MRVACRLFGHRWVEWVYIYTAGRSVTGQKCRRCGVVRDPTAILMAMSKDIRRRTEEQ